MLPVLRQYCVCKISLISVMTQHEAPDGTPVNQSQARSAYTAQKADEYEQQEVHGRACMRW